MNLQLWKEGYGKKTVTERIISVSKDGMSCTFAVL